MVNTKGFVYVLKCKDQKLYIGSTRDLDKRLKAHKMGRVKTTKSRRPVKLIHMEEFESYEEARKRELYLKSGTGRDWLKDKMKKQ
jgi:putative endonuclease